MTYGHVEPSELAVSEARPGSTGEHCCATWHGTDAAGADAGCQSRLSRALSPTRGLSALTKNWPVESRCKNRAPVPSCQASSNYLSYVATQLFLLAPTPKLRGSRGDAAASARDREASAVCVAADPLFRLERDCGAARAARGVGSALERLGGRQV